ncbi:lipopolysaccharide biosynthesis protein [Micromonospora sp. URMC 105]|uniref:lipopolysaccharide biosynthesis protein n=1 Tax=Micromonospora sp. URMC 105 TaxID=3423413 RepID=UPI003F1B1A2D
MSIADSHAAPGPPRPGRDAPPAAGGTPRRHAADVAWSLAGLAAATLAQWGLILVLARIGSPVMVGQYALGLAVSAPVVLICGLGLHTVLVTDMADRFVPAEYLRARLTGVGAALLVIGLLAAVAGTAGATVVFLVAVAKALDGVGEIFFAVLQRGGRVRVVGRAMTVNGTITLAAAVGLLLATGDLRLAVLGSVLGSLVGSVGYPLRTVRRLRARGKLPPARPAPRRDRAAPRLWRLAVTALPVGLASGLASFSVNVPRYVVEHRLGAAALGVFAALSYVLLAANMLFSAMYQVLLPRMSAMLSRGERRTLVRLVARLVAGALLLGAAGVLAAAVGGRRVLGALYGPAYAESADALIVFAVAVCASGALFAINTALLAVRRFTHQLVAGVVTVLVAGGVSVLLVPRLGLVGAALTVVVILGSEAVVKGVMLRRALTPAAQTPDAAVTRPVAEGVGR